MKRYIFFLFLLMGASACQPTTETKDLDYDALTDYFNAQNPKWRKAIQSKEVSYIANLYDENAIFAVPNQPYIRGREAIKKQWEQSAQLIDDFSYETQQLQGNGDLVYEIGLAFSTYTIGDTQKMDTTKYLMVWKHIGGNEFRIVADMFNEY